MIIKQNKIIFEESKIISKKKILMMFALVFLFAITLFLVISLNSRGFKDMSTIYAVNMNLLLIIPISSSSLALSSFLIQQMSKNRLADSSILGIGNINLISLMLLIFFVDFNSDFSVNNYLNIYPFVFIIVSMGASFLIYLISYKKNKNISKKFIIIGIILNFTFIAISSALNSFLPSGKSSALIQFTNGFIDSSSPLPMYVSLFGFIVATIWLAFIFEKFKICSTNFSIAKSLGINSNSINMQILLISGLLSGVSYILVGNVAFLGLMAGNMAYVMYKKNYAYSFPATCLIGSIIISLTFLINKNILQSNINTPGLIPILGIPYFLYLIIKEK